MQSFCNRSVDDTKPFKEIILDTGGNYLWQHQIGEQYVNGVVSRAMEGLRLIRIHRRVNQKYRGSAIVAQTENMHLDGKNVKEFEN